MVLYLCVLIVFSLHRESLKLILTMNTSPRWFYHTTPASRTTQPAASSPPLLKRQPHFHFPFRVSLFHSRNRCEPPRIGATMAKEAVASLPRPPPPPTTTRTSMTSWPMTRHTMLLQPPPTSSCSRRLLRFI
jgi:hypothetical protein